MQEQKICVKKRNLEDNFLELGWNTRKISYFCSFRLTSDEVKVANCRACSIQGLAGNQKHTNVTGMKSHSWKQLVSTSILKYCIRGLLRQQ